jgi:ABC-2 type transport system ATP-binding protein
MICGLLKPDSGAIAFYGRTVEFKNPVMKSKIGVCPQEIVIWPKLTCLEQLQFMGEQYNMSSRLAKQRGVQLLRNLGLYEKRNKLGCTLSGGMQRRLNLVLALVHDPEIVILDEPEAGLDPQSRILVREFIRAMAREKTVLFTTHNMDEAERVCDRVAIMDHGTLLAVDTPPNLKNRFGKGTIIEVSVQENSSIQRTIRDLKRRKMAVKIVDHTFIIQSRQVSSAIQTVIKTFNINKISILEMKIRENTLEDVFIALTGRRLRE